ncbi:MAG: hypothetical protein ACI4I5_07260, partial [Acutalibacteraceae bacterium]
LAWGTLAGGSPVTGTNPTFSCESETFYPQIFRDEPIFFIRKHLQSHGGFAGAVFDLNNFPL